MKELAKIEWYQEFIEECRAIIVKRTFNSKYEEVLGKWELGDRILQEEKRGITDSLQRVAVDLNTGERNLWYCLEFRKTYPKFPEEVKKWDKSLSWRKIIQEELTAPKENKIELKELEGEFGLIIIDPPWKYGTEYDKETRRVASPYKELDLEELKTLKDKIKFAENSVLWLWTTHKFIWQAKELMDYFGFEYKLTLVWNKEKMGMGVWLRCQSEFCLLGIKGNPKWNLTNERDLITESRREHSRKPDKFYKMVEKLTSVKNKVDVFGRKKRKGWIIYGNETEKF